MTMTLIETKTLGAAAASIEFTSIPQDFTDLLLLICCRTDRAANPSVITPHINSTTTNQSVRRLFGNGSTVTSSAESNNWAFQSASSAHTANTFTNASLYIPNYAGSTVKSFSVDSVYENNASTSSQSITAGLWNTTSAVTSIQLIDPDANFIVGSVFSLYGILKGTDGIVTTS